MQGGTRPSPLSIGQAREEGRRPCGVGRLLSPSWLLLRRLAARMYAIKLVIESDCAAREISDTVTGFDARCVLTGAARRGSCGRWGQELTMMLAWAAEWMDAALRCVF
jgi:hypothetical protein